MVSIPLKPFILRWKKLNIYIHWLRMKKPQFDFPLMDHPFISINISSSILHQCYQRRNLHLIDHKNCKSNILGSASPRKHLYDDYTTVLALFEHNENITVLPSFWKHFKPSPIDELTSFAVDNDWFFWLYNQTQRPYPLRYLKIM